MKPHYITTKVALLFFAVLHIAAVAQNPVEYLAVNNVKAPICIGGNLFYNKDTSLHISTRYEIPKGSGMSSIHTSGLWITATDAEDNLKCAAQRYCATGHDFFDGPIMPTYNAAYDSFFNRVFKVTRTQVELHKTKFQQLGTGMIAADVDTTLLYWPAKNNQYVAANRSVNIQSNLAPFFDSDADGSYDPVKGDYPLICGDEAIFFVFNDVRAAHGETGGQPLGVEVRGLAEAFIDSQNQGNNSIVFEKRPLNNSTFVRYEIENKSSSPLFNINIGLFYDADLGCYSNDGFATDTTENMLFYYNRTMVDQSCSGVAGYGNIKIAAGVMLLNGKYSSIGGFINGATIGYRDPTTPTEYNNYNKGLWANGQPYIRGDGDTTAFINCGQITDPNAYVTIPIDNSLPSDRRMIGATTLPYLQPTEVKTIDYAFLASLDSATTMFAIADTLKQDADEIQAFYNNTIVPCRAEISTTIGDVNNRLLQVMVYPNPASSQLIVQAPEVITTLQLNNLLGQVVFTAPGNSTKQVVDVSAVPKGIYLLKIKAGLKEAVKKVVVE